MTAALGKIAPKSRRSTMETMIVSIDQANAWEVPPFQRPVRINAKVEAIAEELKADGCSISGTITLGRLPNDRTHYLIDGQHRREAFRLSNLAEAIMDVRVVHFDTMAEMAEEFVQLNTAIVRMRPDDLMRGIAPTLPNLRRLMEECPYVGFANVRRGGESGPLVSVASLLKCWNTSSHETPTNSNNGMSISSVAHALDEDSADNLIRFLRLAHAAFGRDPEYFRLWGNLNLALCMWLYRRLVLNTERKGNTRVSVLNDTQFKSCLMALSSKHDYLDWMQGRLLNDRDRSPCLGRIKQIFQRRLQESGVDKVVLPQPAWSSK